MNGTYVKVFLLESRVSGVLSGQMIQFFPERLWAERQVDGSIQTVGHSDHVSTELRAVHLVAVDPLKQSFGFGGLFEQPEKEIKYVADCMYEIIKSVLCDFVVLSRTGMFEFKLRNYFGEIPLQFTA